MAEVSFYRCASCGNIVTYVSSKKCTVSCCGTPMAELVAGSTDAATEKHVPVVTREGSTLVAKVGEVAHPMLEAHSIQWVAVATDAATQIAYLRPGEAPEATFCVPEGQAATVYEYCNLHGLWKAEA